MCLAMALKVCLRVRSHDARVDAPTDAFPQGVQRVHRARSSKVQNDVLVVHHNGTKTRMLSELQAPGGNPIHLHSSRFSVPKRVTSSRVGYQAHSCHSGFKFSPAQFRGFRPLQVQVPLAQGSEAGMADISRNIPIYPEPRMIATPVWVDIFSSVFLVLCAVQVHPRRVQRRARTVPRVRRSLHHSVLSVSWQDACYFSRHAYTVLYCRRRNQRTPQLCSSRAAEAVVRKDADTLGGAMLNSVRKILSTIKAGLQNHKDGPCKAIVVLSITGDGVSVGS